MLVNTTELKVLREGDKFPIYDNDEDRIQSYKDNMLLFDNKIFEIIENQIQNLPHVSAERKRSWANEFENIYIQLNFPKEIAVLISDLISRRPPIIDVEKDEVQNRINEITNNNEFHTQVLETTLDQANKGSIIFKTYKKDGKEKIEAIQPEYYFVEYERGNKRNLTREFVSWTFKHDKRTYRYIETYQIINNQLHITYQVFEDRTGRLGKEIEITEFFNIKASEVINIDHGLLTHIPLWRCNGDYFGRSIHDGMLPMYDELNNRISQLSKLFDKYSDPTMSGPDLGVDENGKPNKVIGKYIQREQQDAEVNYHTWPAEVDAHIKYIKEVLFLILYIVSPLSPSLYGLESGGNVSGRAIQLKSFRADCSVDRFMAYWKAGIKRIIRTALKLNGTDLNLSDINIEWEKGFSKDDKETAEVEQIRINSGNTSIKSSIMRVDKVSYDKAKEEYDIIQSEQSDEMLNAQKTVFSQRVNNGVSA